MSNRLSTFLALIGLLFMRPVLADEPLRYQLKEDSKLFGFLPVHTPNNAEGAIPFGKPYEQLTSQQQARIEAPLTHMSSTARSPSTARTSQRPPRALGVAAHVERLRPCA